MCELINLDQQQSYVNRQNKKRCMELQKEQEAEMYCSIQKAFVAPEFYLATFVSTISPQEKKQIIEYRCAVKGCERLFFNKIAYDEHCKVSLTSEDLWVHSPCDPLRFLPDGKITRALNALMCPVCGEIFETRKKCCEHMRGKEHHVLHLQPLAIVGFLCPQCLHVFPDQLTGAIHMQKNDHSCYQYPFKDDPVQTQDPVPLPNRALRLFRKICYQIGCTAECDRVVADMTCGEAFALLLKSHCCIQCLRLFDGIPASDRDTMLHKCNKTASGLYVENDCKRFQEFLRRIALKPSQFDYKKFGRNRTRRLKRAGLQLPENPFDIDNPRFSERFSMFEMVSIQFSLYKINKIKPKGNSIDIVSGKQDEPQTASENIAEIVKVSDSVMSQVKNLSNEELENVITQIGKLQIDVSDTISRNCKSNVSLIKNYFSKIPAHLDRIIPLNFNNNCRKKPERKAAKGVCKKLPIKPVVIHSDASDDELEIVSCYFPSLVNITPQHRHKSNNTKSKVNKDRENSDDGKIPSEAGQTSSSRDQIIMIDDEENDTSLDPMAGMCHKSTNENRIFDINVNKLEIKASRNKENISFSKHNNLLKNFNGKKFQDVSNNFQETVEAAILPNRRKELKRRSYFGESDKTSDKKNPAKVNINEIDYDQRDCQHNSLQSKKELLGKSMEMYYKVPKVNQPSCSPLNKPTLPYINTTSKGNNSNAQNPAIFTVATPASYIYPMNNPYVQCLNFLGPSTSSMQTFSDVSQTSTASTYSQVNRVYHSNPGYNGKRKYSDENVHDSGAKKQCLHTNYREIHFGYKYPPHPFSHSQAFARENYALRSKCTVTGCCKNIFSQSNHRSSSSERMNLTHVIRPKARKRSSSTQIHQLHKVLQFDPIKNDSPDTSVRSIDVEQPLGKDGIPTNLHEMKHIIFLDLDNWPAFFQKLPYCLPVKTFVWAFYGGGTCWREPSCMSYTKLIVEKCFFLHKKCGTRKDAADFALCLWLGRMDERLPKQIPFTIFSGDHGFREIEEQMKRLERKTVLVDPHHQNPEDVYLDLISIQNTK